MIELLEVKFVDWRRQEIEKLFIVAQQPEGGGLLTPIRLGRGRFAQVIVGTDVTEITKGMRFFALKFLTRDADSVSFSRNARSRYFAELTYSIRLRPYGGKGIVLFRGAGRMNVKPSEYSSEHDRVKSGDEDVDYETAFGKLYSSAVSRIEKAADFNEGQARRIDPLFLSQIQGEFFVMDAEEGSLEDFLVDWRPWSDRKVFQIDKERGAAMKREVDGRRGVLEKFMRDLSAKATLHHINPRDQRRLSDQRNTATSQTVNSTSRRDCSGMAILNQIGAYAPSLKDRIVLGLWERAAQAVSKVHAQYLVDKVPLAHRDLKFGNFLFSPFDRPENLILTDLGFVAPNTKRGGTTDFSGVREIGMVALGSRLFRGPEQRDTVPPPEVRFRIVDERNVEFFNFGDIDIQIGDRLESPDIQFCQFEPRHKTAIKKVVDKKGRVLATLEDAICNSGTAARDEDFLGYIVKLSGQHSDVFALGAFLYYLASNGQDPEAFYDACVRNAILPEAKDSCVSLALSLCVDSPEAIQADLAAYDDRSSPLKKEPELLERAIQTVRTAIAPKPRSRGFRDSLGAAFGRRSTETEVSRGIRFWRENPTVQRFLRDKNGIAIPFPIVYEVVRCMLRNKSDSYVRTDDPLQAICDVDCSKVAQEIVNRATELCTSAPSFNATLNHYWSTQPLQFFVYLRMAWPVADVESSKTGQDGDAKATVVAERARQYVGDEVGSQVDGSAPDVLAAPPIQTEMSPPVPEPPVEVKTLSEAKERGAGA